MDNVIIKSKIDKQIELMMSFLELPATEQNEVSSQVRAHGFTEFFRRYDNFDLSNETKEKLADLYNILQAVNAGEKKEAVDDGQ
jgi:hypothetical protein